MSSRGVKLWCMAAIRGDRGCSMKLLSKGFGRDTENCGACQACCSCLLKSQQNKSGEQFYVHIKAQLACEHVLLKLTQVCLVCNDQKCRGFPVINEKARRAVPENQGTCFNSVMCCTCGVSSHNRKTQCCDLKYMANKACSECWIFKGVPGSIFHDTLAYSVKGIFRRLMSHHFLKSKEKSSFKLCIEKIYTSRFSFQDFMITKLAAIKETL
jgi:hypothetical protein